MCFGAEGGPRTPTSYLTRPSNVRVYQFRHFGSFGMDFKHSTPARFTSWQAILLAVQVWSTWELLPVPSVRAWPAYWRRQTATATAPAQGLPVGILTSRR